MLWTYALFVFYLSKVQTCLFLGHRTQEVASARKSVESTETLTKEAAEVASDRKASELAAAEKARRSRAAREDFLQGGKEFIHNVTRVCGGGGLVAWSLVRRMNCIFL